jgi:hypothetical protein
VASATDALILKKACSELSRAKKRIYKAKATARFESSCLTASADDKKKATGMRPLEVDGEVSFCAEGWTAEFVKLYSERFSDEDNSPRVQELRLSRLKMEAVKEERIRVRLWMLKEVLSAAARTRGTAPGTDNVTWAALEALLESAVEKLRTLCECRLNWDEGHSSAIRSWANVLIALIPKTPAALKASQWRPVALTSVLQEVYLRVCSQLLELECRPVMRQQHGFSAGSQTMDATDLV